ncbi:MAG: hypothetical protein ACRD0H_09285, partial [Actinomycetes bacterium]
MGTFRWHLRVLEQTGPARVRPANRLRSDGSIPPYRPPPGTRRVPPSGPGRRPTMQPGSAQSASRRESQRRRRDVLLVLMLGVFATLVLVVAVGSVFVPLQLICDGLLGAYVALLVRMRNLAAERDMKLSYLPAQQAHAARRPLPPGYAYEQDYGYEQGYEQAGYAVQGYGQAYAYEPQGYDLRYG